MKFKNEKENMDADGLPGLLGKRAGTRETVSERLSVGRCHAAGRAV